MASKARLFPYLVGFAILLGSNPAAAWSLCGGEVCTSRIYMANTPVNYPRYSSSSSSRGFPLYRGTQNVLRLSGHGDLQHVSKVEIWRGSAVIGAGVIGTRKSGEVTVTVYVQAEESLASDSDWHLRVYLNNPITRRQDHWESVKAHLYAHGRVDRIDGPSLVRLGEPVTLTFYGSAMGGRTELRDPPSWTPIDVRLNRQDVFRVVTRFEICGSVWITPLEVLDGTLPPAEKNDKVRSGFLSAGGSLQKSIGVQPGADQVCPDYQSSISRTTSCTEDENGSVYHCFLRQQQRSGSP